MSGEVFPLKDNQALAVDPLDTVWLSASAGTGKTQVLSARVLRLLLEPGVRPEQILCLTFTKAGAAEMATRVNEVLANWVRLDDTVLAAQLDNIGARGDPDTIARARSLFAAVLDCPGGGLRIDTIHAFAQWLLAAFPEEAGLMPGTQAMEDRDRDLLAHRVLSDLLVEWDGRDVQAIAALEALSLRMGPDGARQWLMRCALAREAWFGPGAWQPPMAGRVKALLGLPADATPDSIAQLCSDDAFDCGALAQCQQTLAEWNTATGRDGAAAIQTWLGLPPAERYWQIDLFAGTLFNKGGFMTVDRVPKALANIAKRDPAYEDAIDRVSASLGAVIEQKALLELAAYITPALEVGRKFALAWDEAKAREGLVDFDDLIRRAASLLQGGAMSAWIRYKLDRQFDHILVDEAQDTNVSQWAIIDALTDDFFAGLGQADDRNRTIFVVGDYKQAIFGFQGTSPDNFASARARYDTTAARTARECRTIAREHRSARSPEAGAGSQLSHLAARARFRG